MITACILTKNSQHELSQLVSSLKFVDQIVVVDDYSTDNTKTIATAHRCDFFQRHLNHDFAAQRNFALTKAKHDWVLFVDPDEGVSELLAEEIINTIKNAHFDGYFIKRVDVLFGKPLRYGETGHLKLLRLGKKSAGHWARPVHEIWRIPRSGELKHPLSHRAHSSISSFLNKINYYTTIEAEFRYHQNQTTNLLQLVAYPTGKFIQNYFLKLGFLDGFEGFIMAIMMSFHSFFVRAKLLAKRR